MANLEVIDLYEKSSKTKSEKFLENIDSNLRVKTDVKKSVRDLEWIEKMEETIPYIDNIFRAPNRFIVNEEEIVKIELARKITVDSIKHLSRNTNLIQSIDEKNGDVKPSKILNILKEESYDTYENRLIYSLIQNMKMFINRRKTSLEQALNNENGGNKDNKSLEYNATSKVLDEKIEVNMALNSYLDYEEGKSEENTREILDRIEALERNVSTLTGSDVYKIIEKKHITLVREPIKKTNVILKNVNFQYAMKLWNYLRDNYDDKSAMIAENKDYIDNGELKRYIDETFALQYLSMKSLEEDFIETEETREEIQDTMIEHMIDTMIDFDTELSAEELKERIVTRYEVIKYKKMQVMQDIEKIFKEQIDSYLQKVEN